ncbi:hypothetical protein PybrP1_010536 [[Pythium] brassicae (nom. inval.)]|nr:hypothetical protein PybrP1_010536 [[Pythium] brassicae (nom. inval.)]
MSDSEEYEYEYDSDEAYNSDEQLEGSDGEGAATGGSNEKSAARETAIELENTFYEAEDLRQRGELAEARELFEKVVALEQPALEHSPEGVRWSFQAYEHIVKICAHRAQWDDMLAGYQRMLAFLPYVTRNESTDSISSILDVVSAQLGGKESAAHTSKMYEITLERLKGAHNERLWFNMNVKLGKLYLDIGEFAQLRRLLDELYAYCQTPEGSNDQSKATALLDVYSLDIQWMLAYNEFFESFRNYQEAGNARATQSLKYVVLSNMLASSAINPFDSREAKVYQDVEEIGAMLLLRGAYESNDIVQFEKVLKNPKYKLLSDPIMNKYLNPLLRNIRCQVLKKIVRPYHVIQLASLAKAMNVSRREVEEIAVGLIQNDELDARIDQKQGLLALQTLQKNRDASKLFDALNSWTIALDRAHSAIASRVASA